MGKDNKISLSIDAPSKLVSIGANACLYNAAWINTAFQLTAQTLARAGACDEMAPSARCRSISARGHALSASVLLLTPHNFADREFCEYHVASAYQKLKSSRLELSHTFAFDLAANSSLLLLICTSGGQSPKPLPKCRGMSSNQPLERQRKSDQRLCSRSLSLRMAAELLVELMCLRARAMMDNPGLSARNKQMLQSGAKPKSAPPAPRTLGTFGARQEVLDEIAVKECEAKKQQTAVNMLRASVRHKDISSHI